MDDNLQELEQQVSVYGGGSSRQMQSRSAVTFTHEDVHSQKSGKTENLSQKYSMFLDNLQVMYKGSDDDLANAHNFLFGSPIRNAQTPMSPQGRAPFTGIGRSRSKTPYTRLCKTGRRSKRSKLKPITPRTHVTTFSPPPLPQECDENRVNAWRNEQTEEHMSAINQRERLIESRKMFRFKLDKLHPKKIVKRPKRVQKKEPEEVKSEGEQEEESKEDLCRQPTNYDGLAAFTKKKKIKEGVKRGKLAMKMLI